jgi:hypothetical protein
VTQSLRQAERNTDPRRERRDVHCRSAITTPFRSGRRSQRARPVDSEQLARIHRHWIWADHAKRTFDEALGSEGWDDVDVSSGRVPWAMFLRYRFLYVVVDGFTARQILSESPLSIDVDQLREPLHNVRHAMFHVDRDHDYYDPRLTGTASESAVQVRRVQQSLGPLALDEMRRRKRPQSLA